MPKKGKQFVEFTDEERTEIVGKYLSDKYEYHSLANEYRISLKTVESIVRIYRENNTPTSSHNERESNIYKFV